LGGLDEKNHRFIANIKAQNNLGRGVLNKDCFERTSADFYRKI
jgi:hypothetical protein